MLHVSLIVIFAAVVLHDEGLRPPGIGLVSPGWAAVLSLAPMALIALVFGLYSHVCARRLDRGDVRAILRADRAMGAARLAAVGLHVFNVLLLGWVDAVRALVGNPVLLDELLAVAPPLAVILAGWWSIYPLDRRVRDAALLSDLDQGRAVRYPISRGGFVWLQARHQMALVAVPMLLLMCWRGGWTWASNELAAAGERGHGSGWLARVDAWLSAHDRRDMMLGLVQLAGVAGVLLAMPLVLRRVWDTAPLEPGPLFDRLTAMCRRQGVRIRRLLVWRTHGTMVNGAVVGFIGPTRYVLLTDSLLESLPREHVEAVMAHEIGHIRRRHVPWLGVTLIAALGGAELLLRLALAPVGVLAGKGPPLLQTAAELGLFAVVLAAGLVVFGWVSRRFEWQADAFAAQHLSSGDAPGDPADRITPGAVAAMAESLESVARLNHIPLRRFTFRHGSIATRIARLAELVGRPVESLPIDRQVRWIKLASGLVFTVVVVLLVVDLVRHA